ncbi:hypothetical protein ACHAWF_004529 [Thalassiosira exigua]
MQNSQKYKAPENYPPPSATDLSSKEGLFVHWEYHPNDIPRKQIRAIYDDTLKDTLANTLGIKQTTIAFSRPENIRELLTRAKLHQAPGQPASKYYSGER